VRIVSVPEGKNYQFFDLIFISASSATVEHNLILPSLPGFQKRPRIDNPDFLELITQISAGSYFFDVDGGIDQNNLRRSKETIIIPGFRGSNPTCYIHDGVIFYGNSPDINYSTIIE
jgi:hypothetical protein